MNLPKKKPSVWKAFFTSQQINKEDLTEIREANSWAGKGKSDQFFHGPKHSSSWIDSSSFSENANLQRLFGKEAMKWILPAGLFLFFVIDIVLIAFLIKTVMM